MASPSPSPSPTNLDEYSPSSTLIPFERPVPLLRGPIPAGPSDDPSSGPFVLAFKDEQSWISAHKACESEIIQQCETGARIGCSIAASSKCAPPWWKTLTRLTPTDFAERAKCEEREMAICVEASKGKCRQFAKEKCLPAFREARIAVNGSNSKVNRKELSKLISPVFMSGRSLRIALIDLEKTFIKLEHQLQLTNYRGSDLLGSNSSIEGENP